MINIAIFASGSGSNAEEIIKYFESSSDITVKLILSNKKEAFVHQRAEKYNIPSVTFNRNEFYESEVIETLLKDNKIKFIVLAGFLWLFPKRLVEKFPKRIVNIHPALLPKYGGKGMYGDKVHQAVIENKETLSGITIHYVNEHYDEGDIIFQASCKVEKEDRAKDVAEKVHQLEHRHFPKKIEEIVLQELN